MIQTILISLLYGAGVFGATALFLGKNKASKLPGGAILAAFILAPWWAALIGALVGHFGTAYLVNKFL